MEAMGNAVFGWRVPDFVGFELGLRGRVVVLFPENGPKAGAGNVEAPRGPVYGHSDSGSGFYLKGEVLGLFV